MNYNIEALTKKVDTFFEELNNSNNSKTPSVLFTHGKKINFFEKNTDISTDINLILNNINSNENDLNNVIILDSSFNPPTLAHLKLLTETFKFCCEQIISNKKNKNKFINPTFLLLFTNNNVDKKLVGSNLSQRLKMMEIVVDVFQNQIVKMINDSYNNLKSECNIILFKY